MLRAINYKDFVIECVIECYTVESGYNEHGYNDIPAIVKSFLGTEFSPVIFNMIKYGYNESGYSEIMLIVIMKASFLQTDDFPGYNEGLRYFSPVMLA